MKRIKITIPKLLVAQEVDQAVYVFLETIGNKFFDAREDANGSVIIKFNEDNDILNRIVQLYMADLSKKFGLGPIDVEIN
jgi:hypothetical protein